MSRRFVISAKLCHDLTCAGQWLYRAIALGPWPEEGPGAVDGRRALCSTRNRIKGVRLLVGLAVVPA